MVVHWAQRAHFKEEWVGDSQKFQAYHETAKSHRTAVRGNSFTTGKEGLECLGFKPRKTKPFLVSQNFFVWLN